MTAAVADSDLVIARAAQRARILDRLAPWALIAPALVVAGVFFAVPAAYMARMSFNLKIGQTAYEPGFTLEHYAKLLTDEIYVGAIWTTIWLSLSTAIVTLIIGYGFALFAWLRPAKTRLILLGIALCPFLISEISIILGWYLFLPRNGLLSYALLNAGLITDKVSLLYTEFAALVGLVYLTLPFCFFILLSIFDGIDRRVLEASSDLGARPLRTFVEVLLPLTRTGILVAFAQAFIWAMGTYVTPTYLGPDTLWTIGFMVQEQMQARHNWPLAAAFAMILVLIVLLVMTAIRALMSKRTRYHA
jgi:ABC-type spermidine/putrescine transport system permease subunit I